MRGLIYGGYNARGKLKKKTRMDRGSYKQIVGCMSVWNERGNLNLIMIYKGKNLNAAENKGRTEDFFLGAG